MLTRTSTATIDGLPSPSSHNYGTVAYPALARHMSSHQPTQGYAPGARGSTLPPPVPAFVVPSEATSTYTQAQESRNLAGVGVGASSWGRRRRRQHPTLDSGRAAVIASVSSPLGYSTAFSAPMDPRAAARVREAEPEPARRHEEEREEEEEERRRNGGKPRLRTVLLPNATLPRFLAIASVNTAWNFETCGFLLGREVVKSELSSVSRFVLSCVPRF
jgi:hypothetical protein